jgi:hypothetical protein
MLIAPKKDKTLSIRMTEEDFDKIKSKAAEKNVSAGQYLIDCSRSRKPKIVPAINEDALIALRVIAQSLREQSLLTPEIHKSIQEVHRILMGA